MLRNIWPEDKLLRILTPVLNGAPETRGFFDNISDAKAFRFACYKFRKRTNIGAGLSFVIERPVLMENGLKIPVLIRKTPEPTISMAEPSGAV